MQSKHHREEGLPPATHQYISALFFNFDSMLSNMNFFFISGMDIVGANQFYTNQLISNA
jgi:hypothetical protein